MTYPSNTTLLTSAPIADSWALGRQLSRARNAPSFRSFRRYRQLPRCIPIGSPTGASLTEPCFFRTTRTASLRPRTSQFFANTTFSASKSSACCVTIFFSRPFFPPADAAAGSHSLPSPHTSPSSGRT